MLTILCYQHNQDIRFVSFMCRANSFINKVNRVGDSTSPLLFLHSFVTHDTGHFSPPVPTWLHIHLLSTLSVALGLLILGTCLHIARFSSTCSHKRSQCHLGQMYWGNILNLTVINVVNAKCRCAPSFDIDKSVRSSVSTRKGNAFLSGL